MRSDRLLTYAVAAQRMGISEKAFRTRVARGSIPDRVLADRERPGKRPERFVKALELEAWLIGDVDRGRQEGAHA